MTRRIDPLSPAAYAWAAEDAAERSAELANACGRTCGCPDLCNFGERKAERMAEERWER